MHVAQHMLDDKQMIDQEKLIWLPRMGGIGTVEQIKTPCLKLKNPLPLGDWI